jgi:hypothetical protein
MNTIPLMKTHMARYRILVNQMVEQKQKKALWTRMKSEGSNVKLNKLNPNPELNNCQHFNKIRN